VAIAASAAATDAAAVIVNAETETAIKKKGVTHGQQQESGRREAVCE